MRGLRILVPTGLVAVCLCTAALAAEPTAVAPPAAKTPAPPAAVSVPDDSDIEFSCAGDVPAEMSPLGPKDSASPAGGGGIPDCPVNYDNCHDLPGQACRPVNCVTIDLGYDTCRKPNGRKLTCVNGNLQQTTCGCHVGVHSICCDDGTCSWGDCGVCGNGTLSTVCP